MNNGAVPGRTADAAGLPAHDSAAGAGAAADSAPRPGGPAAREARLEQNRPRVLRFLIEYDGTGYCGWQRQRGSAAAGLPSVQATLEAAVREATGESGILVGAGRTDAGVHALGQVAGLRTASRIPVARFAPALNARLPADVRVLDAREAAPGFHARFDAIARAYRYEILNRAAASALLRHRAHHVPEPLDLDAMRTALAPLVGRHDFRAYQGAGSNPKTAVCQVLGAAWTREGDRIALTITADRFLRHMVRLLVGTLLRVGRGRLPADAPAGFLGDPDNRRAGPTAPPHGLYLARVDYPETAGWYRSNSIPGV